MSNERLKWSVMHDSKLKFLYGLIGELILSKKLKHNNSNCSNNYSEY